MPNSRRIFGVRENPQNARDFGQEYYAQREATRRLTGAYPIVPMAETVPVDYTALLLPEQTVITNPLNDWRPSLGGIMVDVGRGGASFTSANDGQGDILPTYDLANKMLIFNGVNTSLYREHLARTTKRVISYIVALRFDRDGTIDAFEGEMILKHRPYFVSQLFSMPRLTGVPGTYAKLLSGVEGGWETDIFLDWRPAPFHGTFGMTDDGEMVRVYWNGVCRAMSYISANYHHDDTITNDNPGTDPLIGYGGSCHMGKANNGENHFKGGMGRFVRDDRCWSDAEMASAHVELMTDYPYLPPLGTINYVDPAITGYVTAGLVNDWDVTVNPTSPSLFDSVGGKHAVFDAGAAAPTRELYPPMLNYSGAQAARTAPIQFSQTGSTVMGVIRVDVLPTGYQYMFDHSHELGNWFKEFAVIPMGTNLGSYWRTSTSDGTTVLDAFPEPQTLSYAVTVKDDRANLYINGKCIDTATIIPMTPAQAALSAPMIFGAPYFGNSFMFEGSQGRTWRYTRALTEAEIQQNHVALKQVYRLLPDIAP